DRGGTGHAGLLGKRSADVYQCRAKGERVRGEGGPAAATGRPLDPPAPSPTFGGRSITGSPMTDSTDSRQSAPWHGTTILSVRKDGRVVVAGDGQVTFGNTVIKSGAMKVRRLAGGNVIAGFAGATADAFTLFE